MISHAVLFSMRHWSQSETRRHVSNEPSTADFWLVTCQVQKSTATAVPTTLSVHTSVGSQLSPTDGGGFADWRVVFDPVKWPLSVKVHARGNWKWPAWFLLFPIIIRSCPGVSLLLHQAAIACFHILISPFLFIRSDLGIIIWNK